MNDPIKNILEPEHETVIQNVKANTQYYLRIRANDNMGKGRPTNPILVKTQKPGNTCKFDRISSFQLFLLPFKSKKAKNCVFHHRQNLRLLVETRAVIPWRISTGKKRKRFHCLNVKDLVAPELRTLNAGGH